MAKRDWQRFAPLTGLLFVILTVVSFLIEGEPPDNDAPGREIVEFYTDNEGRVIVGAILASLAAVSLIFFAANVRRALRRGEQGVGVLSVAALGGGIVAATGIATDAAIRFTLADGADDIEPVAMQTLHALWSGFFLPMVVGIATLILALSLAALRTRVIPPWLAWIGFLLFIMFFTPIGFIAFLASGLWIAVVSVLLWRQEPAASV